MRYVSAVIPPTTIRNSASATSGDASAKAIVQATVRARLLHSGKHRCLRYVFGGRIGLSEKWGLMLGSNRFDQIAFGLATTVTLLRAFSSRAWAQGSSVRGGQCAGSDDNMSKESATRHDLASLL